MLNSFREKPMASRPNRGVINGGLHIASSLYEKRELDNCKRRNFPESSFFSVPGTRV